MERIPPLESTPPHHDSVTPVHLEDELKFAYLGYAMSVIVGRALPDVRDGLKPVQRRILYAMHELGNVHSKPYKKSARIVGDVSGKYHPHGDVPAYEALVRMAQDFSLRCPLVDGQGNFGSVDGDPAADRRYTEVRLMPLAEALLKDLDKGAVDFVPNYDGAETLPSVLPAGFPNLLVNGSSGIAVGMATNIPPHNLGEALDACIAYLNNPKISVEALMEHLPGPDFPTGGILCGSQGVLNAYRTGKGRIVLRARAAVESHAGKERIVIREIPYQVNKSRLLESIAELVKAKTIEGITEIRDESDREGLRVVLELRRGSLGELILKRLFALTALEQPFSANLVVLDHGRPIQANLIRILEAFIAHRKTVTVRKARFECDKVEARLHLLEGLRVAICDLDKTIALIREAHSSSEAKQALLEHAWTSLSKETSHQLPVHLRSPDFRLSEAQAQAILDLRLHRLTQLEMGKIQEEEADARARQQELYHILNDPQRLKAVIQEEFQALKAYATPRRTEIEGAADLEDDDLIPDETVVVTLSQKGYVKSQLASEYSVQRRGGKGKLSAKLRSEDVGAGCLVASTHDRLLCFSTRGRLYWLRVHQIPKAARLSKGRPINNLLPLLEDESITAILALKKGDHHAYVILASALGVVKKIALEELQSQRISGVNALKLQEGDQVVGAAFTSGRDEVLLFSAEGKVVRFPESQIRPMGRSASGVRGLRLDKHDQVVSLCIPQIGESLLTLTENGFGKRTDLVFYPQKSRATKGVVSIKMNERNGRVVGALAVAVDAEVLLLTHQGHLLRLRVEEIGKTSRNTQGVTLVKLEVGDKLVGMQKILGDLEAKVE